MRHEISSTSAVRASRNRAKRASLPVCSPIWDCSRPCWAAWKRRRRISWRASSGCARSMTNLDRRTRSTISRSSPWFVVVRKMRFGTPTRASRSESKAGWRQESPSRFSTKVWPSSSWDVWRMRGPSRKRLCSSRRESDPTNNAPRPWLFLLQRS